MTMLEYLPIVAYAWRKEGMKGWALGHNPPTSNMIDFDKYEVRELTFRTHAEQIERDAMDAERYRWLRRKVCIIAKDGLLGQDKDRYAVFEILDMPMPTHIAPRPDIEFDASIDAAMSKEGE